MAGYFVEPTSVLPDMSGRSDVGKDYIQGLSQENKAGSPNIFGHGCNTAIVAAAVAEGLPRRLDYFITCGEGSEEKFVSPVPTFLVFTGKWQFCSFIIKQNIHCSSLMCSALMLLPECSSIAANKIKDFFHQTDKSGEVASLPDMRTICSRFFIENIKIESLVVEFGQE